MRKKYNSKGAIYMEKYEVVSFIPARGGSVRIPRKNVKMLAGKPMINWTIEASLKSKYITRTFVSTEDAEIKDIALKAGAEVIGRSEESTHDGMIAINMALNTFMEYLHQEKYCPDIFVYLYATNPLRTAKHIDEAFELYINSKEDFLISLSPAENVDKFLRYIDDKTGLVEFFYNSSYFTPAIRRQAEFRDKRLPLNVYRENGAVYIGTYPHCFSTYAVCNLNHVLPYIINEEDAFDVNTPLDFKIAEGLLEKRLKKEGG